MQTDQIRKVVRDFQGCGFTPARQDQALICASTHSSSPIQVLLNTIDTLLNH